MARNVEIKARIESVETLLPLALACIDVDADDGANALTNAQGSPETIAQDDTFFHCASGRLKLRVFADGRGELIAYERPDSTDPKTSDYAISSVADPDALRVTLARALGVSGRVVKQRTLVRVGRTRVHLDRVEGLGDFLELEVVLHEGESADAGMAVAHALLQRLQVDASQWVAGAYVDLLRIRGADSSMDSSDGAYTV